MEKELQEFQYWDYLEGILDHVQEGIYITDREANTVYMNHAYELISGLVRADLLGENMRDLEARGVVSASGTLMVLETHERVTIEQSFKTGKRALITSTPVYDDPVKRENILMIVTSVREVTALYSVRKELDRLKQQNREYVNELKSLKEKYNEDSELVAVAPSSVQVTHLAGRVAITDTPVLIAGEEATGKERMARYIHDHSGRADYPFMKLNFSVIPPGEAVDYLFGWEDSERGEYRMGILEIADGGTVYLDELTDMPRQVRGRFLALLTTGSCVMGDGTMRRLNVRFLAGSSVPFEELQKSGEIEAEILNCFSLFPLRLLPLRERKEDVLPLLAYFLRQHEKKTGERKHFSKDCYDPLLAYDWPGNVRELKSLVQRAVIISEGEEICPTDIIFDVQNETRSADTAAAEPDDAGAHPVLTDAGVDLKTEVARLEAEYMSQAFAKYQNTRDAADALGMDSSTFVRKRQRYEKLGLMSRERRKMLRL